MTLPSSVDITNDVPSFMNSRLLIGCHSKIANVEMTVGCDDGDVKSGARSTIVMWHPEKSLEGEGEWEKAAYTASISGRALRDKNCCHA